MYSIVNLALAGLLVLVPIIVIVLRLRRGQGVVIDHILVFSAAFLLYFSFPMALGASQIRIEDAALLVWYSFFRENLGPTVFTEFAAFSLGLYVAFVGAAVLGERGERAPRRLSLSPDALVPLWIPVVAVGVAYLWKVHGSMFSGYSAYDTFYAAAGTLSAVTLVLVAFALLHAAYSPVAMRASMTARMLRLVAALFCASLLSLGGRLYAAATVVAVLVFVSCFRAPLPTKRAVLILGGTFVGAGAVGLLRLGHGVSPVEIAANLAAEPLFTSFSIIHFVGHYPMAVLHAPVFLAGDFLNLVPSALFPGKTAYLPNLSHAGYVVYAPVGALHMALSFLVNFGVVGTLVVIAALGFALSRLRDVRTPLAAAIYSMLSGSLAFTFFRDPFSVSIVKNMVEFSVLVPAAIVAAGHVVSTVVNAAALGGHHRSEVRA